MPKYEYLAPNLADLAAYLAATGEEGKEGRS
jgi:hypothetical protein